MELLILGAVGVLGYGMANTNRPHRVIPAPMRIPHDPCALDCGSNAEDNAVTRQNLTEAYKREWQASRDPRGTGVIPFYRSEKNMAISAENNQNKLELFTGQLDMCKSKNGTYQNKREMQPMFAPSVNRNPVTSSGRQAYVDVRDGANEERFQLGMKHHGSGPSDPIRVGPGLGLGPDVPAAGGFQQYFRVCPSNTNGYRRHTLPGSVIPGKAVVGQSSTVGTVRNIVQKPMWGLQPTQGRSCVTAPACYGQQAVSQRQDSTTGMAGHAHSGNAPPARAIFAGHARDDAVFGGNVLNAHNQGIASGAYINQQPMDPGAFRQELNRLPTGTVSGPVVGHVAGMQAKPTQREQSGLPASLTAPCTASTVRNQHVRSTGREHLDQRHFMTGTASSQIPAPAVASNHLVDKPDTCVGYMPNGSKSEWKPNVTTMRTRCHQAPGQINTGALTSVNYAHPGSNQSCMNKLQSKNQFLDLTLTKDILNTNPLTHPIYA